MKKRIILPLLSILVLGFAGCKKNETPDKTEEWQTYHEDYVYKLPAYEPIDVSREGGTPYSITVIGIPSKGILQTEWDDNDIKLRCFYDDGVVLDYEFRERNIPIDYRHYLGEVGTHKLSIKYGLMPLEFEFKVVSNPNWKGFTCYFFNLENKLIHTQVAGYYASIQYTGPEVPQMEEDDDYQYHFSGWNHSTKYVYQDMQFKTVYDKLEKRLYAVKPYQFGYESITGVVGENKNKGSSLIYLGRVRRAAALYGEIKCLDSEDIELKFNYGDYGTIWNDLNKSIISKIKYEHDPNYDSNIYGSVANLLSAPDYGTMIDSKYNYHEGAKVSLEDGKEVSLSAIDPYVYLSNRVLDYVDKTETVKGMVNSAGYYRLAVLFDFDVYLSMSYKRIGESAFEIGEFNEFVCCPIVDTLTYDIQYSKTDEFVDNFNTNLTLSDKAVYNNAAMLDWGKWQA